MTTDHATCRGRARDWDLDQASRKAARDAMASCATCPLLAWCELELEQRLSDGDPPRSSIQAGRAFGASGAELSTRRLLRRRTPALRARTTGVAS